MELSVDNNFPLTPFIPFVLFLPRRQALIEDFQLYSLPKMVRPYYQQCNYIVEQPVNINIFNFTFYLKKLPCTFIFRKLLARETQRTIKDRAGTNRCKLFGIILPTAAKNGCQWNSGSDTKTDFKNWVLRLKFLFIDGCYYFHYVIIIIDYHWLIVNPMFLTFMLI